MNALLDRVTADPAPQPSLQHPGFWRVPGRIAYIVSHSYPYSSNGYAVRTHGVASALVEHGYSVVVVNRPGRPWDLPGFSDSAFPIHHNIDGVRYLHLPQPSSLGRSESDYLAVSIEALKDTLRLFKPSAVMAASNYETALPAAVAARELGLPFSYEVRGFWEITRASLEPAWQNSAAFKHCVEIETAVAKQSDWVFTLNRFMRDELVRRGVDGGKIGLVPNACAVLPDLSRPSRLNREAIGCKARYAVGYIGSFSDYEGLDDLVRACAQLRKDGVDLSLLLVGSSNPLGAEESAEQCPKSAQLSQLAQDLGFREHLHLSGRVKPEALADYYALIDLIVIPRKPLPVCQLVSPIKALEALAYGKPLLVSDVKPLKELADNTLGVKAFTSGDLDSLCRELRSDLWTSPLTRSAQLRDTVKAGHLFLQATKPMIAAINAVSQPRISLQRGNNLLHHRPPASEQREDAPQRAFMPLQIARAELADTPQWYEDSVKPDEEVVISGAVEYQAVEGPKDRAAVLLVKAFDSQGKELDVPCGKLAWSEHLKSHFKYLACSSGLVAEQHSFRVPANAVRIRVGICRFNAEAIDRIFVENVGIESKAKKNGSTEFVPPSKQAAEISILGWPEYPENGRPYAIGVMDEFTTGCFEKELNLIQPRPDNWYALAEKYQPAMFFIESAWKGNYGSWQYRVAEYSNKPGQEIAHMAQYARQKGIPLVFWNKEDPVHHNKFMCSAKLADHIFTTDANMRASYREKTGNHSVHALPFAAQPALHRPAPLEGRLPRSCFAGSWYGNRHAERGEAMRWLLKAANRHGLDIYDRNHGTGLFPFPEEYQQGIKGSLPYEALCRKYSRYRVFLNVNSVTDSPTMFSRRVFELMACGTPVVSTYARGIDELFESDAVWLVNSQAEADEAIHALLIDDAEWRRRSLAGIREVFARHTYAHRLNTVFERIGLSTRLEVDPRVLFVARAHGETQLKRFFRFAEMQQYRNFTLLIECQRNLNATCFAPPENVELADANFIQGAAFDEQAIRFSAVGWISDQSSYGPNYVRDLVNAMGYQPDADGWAKALDADAYSFGNAAQLDGALWKSSIFRKNWKKSEASQEVRSPYLFSIDSAEYSFAVHQLALVGA